MRLNPFLTTGLLSLVFTIVTLKPTNLVAQERINLSAGVGFTESLNIGVRYQIKQSQVGLLVGSLFENLFDKSNTRRIYISGTFQQHLFGLSKYSERKPWFLKLGTTYERAFSDVVVENMGYWNLAFGRDMNLSNRLGFAVSAGISSRAIYTNNIPNTCCLTQETGAIYPGFEMYFFYRFLNE
jgi:hypothetical protein